MPEPIYGADQRDRVEPVVDATSPEDDAAALVHVIEHAPDARPYERGRVVRCPERDHIDEPTHRVVGAIGRRIDSTEARQLAKPEIALFLTRADEEVAAQQLLVQDCDSSMHGVPPGIGTAVSALL